MNNGSPGRWLAYASGGLLLLAVGCGGDPDPPPGPSHEVAYCNAICETTERCLYSVVSNCNQLCVDEHQSWLSRFDPEAARATAECMLERPCSEVEAWEHEGWCRELVSSTLPPTEAQVEYCEALSPAWFDCGYRADLVRCVESHRMLGAAVLTEALDCAARELSCEEMEGCLQSTFDF